jgi:tetratricopeptide (TPR) repeat protein
MNKNTIIVERNKLRAEIKDLVIQYESLKEKDGSLETIGPIKAERMFEILNSIAMRYAKDGFIEYAESWLLKAEPLTVKNPRQAIILHNNMACIFKNQGSFDKALKHLEQSEAILKNIRSKLNYNKRFDRLLIDCWLNLSAIYSSKKMHL